MFFTLPNQSHSHIFVTLIFLPKQECEQFEVILTAFAAEPAEFRDQEGMNNKVTAMLGITSHGGTSG